MRADSPGTNADTEEMDEDSWMDIDSYTEGEDLYDEDSELDLESDRSRLREFNEESGTQTAGGEAKLAMSKLMEIIDKKEQEIEKKNMIIQNLLMEMRKDRDEVHEMKCLQKSGEFKVPKGKKRPRRKSCEGKEPANGSNRNGGEKTKIDHTGQGHSSWRKRNGHSLHTGPDQERRNFSKEDRNTTFAEQKAKSTQEEAQQEEKVYKAPPIVLREEGKLDIIGKQAEANGIVISNCRDSAEGTKLFPKTAIDQRRLKQFPDGKDAKSTATYSFAARQNTAVCVAVNHTRPSSARGRVRDSLPHAPTAVKPTMRLAKHVVITRIMSRRGNKSKSGNRLRGPKSEGEQPSRKQLRGTLRVPKPRNPTRRLWATSKISPLT
ncbi:hypothetical protein Trydic_g20885 [Trypoxylus dichotomus]